MVAVIGGGVIGLCAALYAARAGRRVLLLERHGPDGDSCSLGNAGMVTPSHLVPLASPGAVRLGMRLLADPEGAFGIRWGAGPGLWRWLFEFRRSATNAHVERAAPVLAELLLASRADFGALAAETDNAFRLEERGIVMLCREEATLADEEHLAELAHRSGIAAELLDPAGLAALDPSLTMRAAGGVYFPGDCHLEPERLVAALRDLAARAGVAFRWETPALGWRRRAGGRAVAVVTPGGEVAADDFVVAGGSATEALLRPLGCRVPIQPGKGYSFTVPTPPRLPRVPAILVEARIAVTPMGGGLRFAGTMELGGLPGRVEPARVRGIRRAIPAYYPEFGEADLATAPVWAGLRPCTPDGLPYIGRLPTAPNVLVAAGHAMLGVSLGPVTGRCVAALLTGAEPPVPLTLLQPQRFDARHSRA